MPKERPKRSGAFTAEENQVLRSAIDTVCETLFPLDFSAGENVNVAEDEQYAAVVEEMSKRVRAGFATAVMHI